MINGIANDTMYACGRSSIRGFRRRDGVEATYFGTAFFVLDELLKEVYIVTCRHNVDPAFHAGEEKPVDFEIAELGFRTFNTGSKAPGSLPTDTFEVTIPPTEFVYHPDRFVDVAICRTTNIDWDVRKGSPYFQYMIPTGMFCTTDDFASSVHVGSQLVFPGFPRWYDKNGDRPILRTGTICSDPRVDYRSEYGDPSPSDGAQQMLYEAFSWSGDSGSPVFVEGRRDSPLEAMSVTGPAPRFLGVNCGHFQDEENRHSGLSRLVKATAVTDLVNGLRDSREAPDFELVEVRQPTLGG